MVQPDLSHAGGISELRRIAVLAETCGALLAPHCPLGPISLAASLQVAFATPNFLIQEQSLGIHYNVDNDLLDYLVDPTVFAFRDGHVDRPVAAGAGDHGRRAGGARGRPRRPRCGARRCGGVPTVRSPNGEARRRRVERVPLLVDTDLAQGGRWTSLRTADREWLWSRPDPQRALARPGDEFVDVGGLEECFPTVRGEPDHGWAWSTPWDSGVAADGIRLERALSIEDGAVMARYRVDGPPGYRFVYAAHALLDLSTDASIEAPARRATVTDDPRPLGVDASWTGAVPWPRPWGLPLHELGPSDGTAIGVILDCAEACVVDGSEALSWDISGDALPLAVALWRNLGGFPSDGPYRSIGVEPMVGTGFDRSSAGAATIPPAGTASWTVHCVAWRRSA